MPPASFPESQQNTGQFPTGSFTFRLERRLAVANSAFSSSPPYIGLGGDASPSRNPDPAAARYTQPQKATTKRRPAVFRDKVDLRVCLQACAGSALLFRTNMDAAAGPSTRHVKPRVGGKEDAKGSGNSLVRRERRREGGRERGMGRETIVGQILSTSLSR